jgi:hypothetical protein
MAQMVAAGAILEYVPLRVAKGRAVRLAGVLKARPTIEEVSFLARPPMMSSPTSISPWRAFRVRGNGLVREGLHDGDHLVVRVGTDYRDGTIVLAEFGGTPVLRKVTHGSDGSTRLVPIAESLPFGESASDARIFGSFAGILRRRGFSQSAIGPPKEATSGERCSKEQHAVLGGGLPSRCRTEQVKHPGKVRLLRSRLGSLESTYAQTQNPRLRGALRNEAERVLRLLQNETDSRPG